MSVNTAHIPHAHRIDQSMGRPTPSAEKGRKRKHSKADVVAVIGRIAAVMSVIMYVSYISQIGNNLAGHPGTPWQPLAAFFNCVFWAAYGFLKPKKDWPIIVANVPGVFLALVTFITSFVH